MESSASLGSPQKPNNGYQAVFMIALAIYIIIWKVFPQSNLDFFKIMVLSLLTAGLGMLSYLISKFE